MKSYLTGAAAVAFATLAGFAFVPAASAQELQTEGFLEACNANQDFLNNLAESEGGAEATLGRLCTCLLGEVGDVSQTDLDLLAKDLAGTSTDEERMAYETYEDLSAHASESLNNCLVIEGIIDGSDPGATPAQ